MKWKHAFGALATSTLVAASVLTVAGTAEAAEGRLVPGAVASPAIGEDINYTAYLPAGYDADNSVRYPSLYLLHGRGDTQAAWQQVIADIDELTAAGNIPPMIVIMPDAPWSSAGNYYVDSQYTGSSGGTAPGVAVETGFTRDLLEHVDTSFRTVADRAARAVGGYSMGGAGALRFATAHQDLFSAGIILSPAVYAPSTPVDSSTREFGAYGVGNAVYDESRYQELNYPATFASFDAGLPLHLFIAVGDDEYANPLPEDAIHDLDYEAATLYNQAKRVDGISAELRIYDGGHDWDTWKRGFREGIVDIAAQLRTEAPPTFNGQQFGSADDDRAGGVLGTSDGGVVQAMNAAGDMLGQNNQGGLDVLVQKRASNGEQVWLRSIASDQNERAYGIVDAQDGAVIVAGYMRQEHVEGSNDDGLVVKLDSDGTELWRTSVGSASAADRFYGVTSDTDGGAFVTGYTSGVFGGSGAINTANAGDKDAVVAHIDKDGAVVWSHQFGSSGEDKGFAVSRASDGGVYVGGAAGAAMSGATSFGGYDGWIAKFDENGERAWLNQTGTVDNEQVSGLVTTATGVAATGFTKGSLATISAGEADVFATAVAGNGIVEWITQTGSAGDDRGAAIEVDAAGQLVVVGHTSGHLGSGPVSGGTDVFALTFDPSGAVVDREQLGSALRDGADDWDEANLFIAGGGSTYIQGVTFGSVAGAQNAGAGDVFLTKISFDAIARTSASLPAPGAVIPPAAKPPVASPLPAAAASASVVTVGSLVVAGVDAARWATLAALLLLAGAIMRRMRLSTRRFSA